MQGLAVSEPTGNDRKHADESVSKLSGFPSRSRRVKQCQRGREPAAIELEMMFGGIEVAEGCLDGFP